MSLKAKVEAIIYAAEEPITIEQMSSLLKDAVLADIAAAKEKAALQAEAEAQAAAARTESTEIPELHNGENGVENICPEPGPLMPAHVVSEEVAEEVSVISEGDPTVVQEEAIAEQAETPAPEEAAQEPVAIEIAAIEAPAESAGTESAIAETDTTEPAPAASASVEAPETTSRKRQPKKSEQEIAEDKAVRTRLREILAELVTDYSSEDRGMEIRQVAGGFRMATKPEHHDVVRAFAKSLKPPIRLSLAALETLAVIAYKQPITGPEISDIRGVESAGVLGTLLDRKLITTAGRKQVIGRPMQYKTSKDFLLRFGLNDVNELPSMEEFSQLASDRTIEIEPQSLFESGASAPPQTAEPAPAETTEQAETQSATEPEATEPAPTPEDAAPETQSASAADQGQPASDEHSQSDSSESTNVSETEHPINS